ncbi:hypothetical protein GCM10010211_81680 [Streptomyces albospinus]|uniref:Uncharacterized protein n=1 Tax=Streptomyces albospinus TaxID=285515 RepID=A0ABQ2VRR6_9ACTN|nr:hypothetical protein GCM10010211_81680 [Streptomyces albospinus]
MAVCGGSAKSERSEIAEPRFDSLPSHGMRPRSASGQVRSLPLSRSCETPCISTLAQLRKTALALPEVEATHFGMTAFSIRGKRFASVTKDGAGAGVAA